MFSVICAERDAPTSDRLCPTKVKNRPMPSEIGRLPFPCERRERQDNDQTSPSKLETERFNLENHHIPPCNVNARESLQAAAVPSATAFSDCSFTFAFDRSYSHLETDEVPWKKLRLRIYHTKRPGGQQQCSGCASHGPRLKFIP